MDFKNQENDVLETSTLPAARQDDDGTQTKPTTQSTASNNNGAATIEGGIDKGPAAAKAPEKTTKKPLLDLAKYRGATKALPENETSTGTQTNIPVKKPGSKNFFRVHPDPSYRLYDVAVIEEEGGDVYLVDSELGLPEDVLDFVSHMHLFVAVSHRGKLFVWKFRSTDTSWLASNMRVAGRAQVEWVRIKADFETGGYTIFAAPEPLRSKKPVFPAMSPAEIFTLAFDNRMITSVDDTIIRRLRGLE